MTQFARWISPDAHALAPGSPLPDVEVTDEQGERLNLSQRTDGWVLVYFYPRAGTPGCTAQACSLRDAYADLMGHGVAVFGVSLDSPAALQQFRVTQALPFHLLSDPRGELADAFGVPHAMGLAKRQAFLFKDGLLVWRDLHASTERQADDVLAAIARHG